MDEKELKEIDLEFRLVYADAACKYQQLRKWNGGIPYYNFFTYIPKIEFDNEDIISILPSDDYIRKIIKKFTDGVYQNQYVEIIVIKKLKCVFHYMPERFTLVCIPASTRMKTIDRFAGFMRRVCQDTGIQNGYDYVKITKEGGEGGEDNEYECDKEFFKGRNVIIFDDVLYRGNHLETMKEKLEAAGAEVWAAFFLGKMDFEKPHPWICDDDNPCWKKDQKSLRNIDKYNLSRR